MTDISLDGYRVCCKLLASTPDQIRGYLQQAAAIGMSADGMELLQEALEIVEKAAATARA